MNIVVILEILSQLYTALPITTSTFNDFWSDDKWILKHLQYEELMMLSEWQSDTVYDLQIHRIIITKIIM